MKLYFARKSPFVRKALVVAHEAGIEDKLEMVDCSTTTPVNPDTSNANPLKKIPALELDDGTLLFDSPVVCEYLDTELGNGSLFPRELSTRWTALRFQALADGLLDAAVLLRYETTLRPENLRWDDWVTGQMNKIDGALADLESHAASFGERVDIGTISVACAVAYLDFRFIDKDWRAVCSTLAAWTKCSRSGLPCKQRGLPTDRWDNDADQSDVAVPGLLMPRSMPWLASSSRKSSLVYWPPRSERWIGGPSGRRASMAIRKGVHIPGEPPLETVGQSRPASARNRFVSAINTEGP